MPLSEIACYFFVAWFIIGGISASLCMIFERRLNAEKYIIKDPMDFVIGIFLWPLMLGVVFNLIKPPPSEIKHKKKPKIIVSEQDETEEAFANRCKRL